MKKTTKTGPPDKKKSPPKEWATEEIKKLETAKKKPAKKAEDEFYHATHKAPDGNYTQKKHKGSYAPMDPPEYYYDDKQGNLCLDIGPIVPADIMAKKDYVTEGDFMFALHMKTEALDKLESGDVAIPAAELFAISIDLRCAHNMDPPMDLKDYCAKYGEVCPNDANYYYFRKSTWIQDGPVSKLPCVFFMTEGADDGRFRDEDDVIHATNMRVGVVGFAGGPVVGWEDVTDDEDDSD